MSTADELPQKQQKQGKAYCAVGFVQLMDAPRAQLRFCAFINRC
jgi:hypothetical protein